MGMRFSAPVQTGPGAHPASCKMDNGSFPGVKCGRGMQLTTQFLLVRWSWKSRASGPHRACNWITLPLPFCYYIIIILWDHRRYAAHTCIYMCLKHLTTNNMPQTTLTDNLYNGCVLCSLRDSTRSLNTNYTPRNQNKSHN